MNRRMHKPSVETTTHGVVEVEVRVAYRKSKESMNSK